MDQVLLIDDNAVQLSVRETVLRKAGFAVSVATRADGALATLRVLGERVRLVITDHIMPGRSGAQFVRDLRQENSLVPVIVLSGLPEAEDEYEGLSVVFRQKPVHPEELIQLARTCIASGPQNQAGAA